MHAPAFAAAKEPVLGNDLKGLPGRQHPSAAQPGNGSGAEVFHCAS
jgi:hypothetical protein